MKSQLTPANLHEKIISTTECPVVERKIFFGADLSCHNKLHRDCFWFSLKGEKGLKFSSKKNDLVPDAQKVRSGKYWVLISADHVGNICGAAVGTVYLLRSTYPK